MLSASPIAATQPPADALALYRPVADAIARLFHPHLEVVLHDVRAGRVDYVANARSALRPGDCSTLCASARAPRDAEARPRSLTLPLPDAEAPLAMLAINHIDALPLDGALEARLRAVVAVPAPATPAPQPLARGGIAPHRLRRVSEHVDAHLAEPLLLADLALIAKLSPKHFSRAFSQTMGVSPHRWLIEKRVAAAQTMLRATDKPLSDIALGCGFADQSHFTAMFRRYVGAPPGRWRQACRDGLH